MTAKVYSIRQRHHCLHLTQTRRPRFSFFSLQLSKNRRHKRPSKNPRKSRPKPQTLAPTSVNIQKNQRRVRQPLAAPPPSFSERFIDPTPSSSQHSFCQKTVFFVRVLILKGYFRRVANSAAHKAKRSVNHQAVGDDNDQCGHCRKCHLRHLA